MIMKIFFTVLLVQTFSIAHAAELRGKLTGMRGAHVEVTCPGGSGSSVIASKGGYRVSGLPDNEACSFSVSAGDLTSVDIPFSTRRSVTIYNGNLRRAG